MVELKTWTPVFEFDRGDFRTVFERLPRLFGDVTFDFRPTVDMKREGDDLIVTAELPGMDIEKDVEVTVDGDFLVIKGEKTTEEKTEEENLYLHERHYGSFERRLPIPQGVNPETIEASYDKGVLTIRVPTPSEEIETKKRIPIAT